MQRFTISLDDTLAKAFDDFIARRGYANRSEAVRDLLRAELQNADLADQRARVHCVGCLSYVYNHHERDLAERVTALQHAHHDLTVSSMHAHLDHDHCLETVLLRGPTEAVRRFADALCAERGVHHGHLNLIAVDLHHPHAHEHAAGGHRHGPPAGPGGDAVLAMHTHADGTTHAHAPAPARRRGPVAHDAAVHVHVKPRR
jgi:CopG family transcriptional regulator, nickel-responsive regulator